MIISDSLLLFYFYTAAKRQRQASTSCDDGVYILVSIEITIN
jgi:hypothetical protein